MQRKSIRKTLSQFFGDLFVEDFFHGQGTNHYTTEAEERRENCGFRIADCGLNGETAQPSTQPSRRSLREGPLSYLGRTQRGNAECGTRNERQAEGLRQSSLGRRPRWRRLGKGSQPCSPDLSGSLREGETTWRSCSALPGGRSVSGLGDEKGLCFACSRRPRPMAHSVPARRDSGQAWGAMFEPFGLNGNTRPGRRRVRTASNPFSINHLRTLPPGDAEKTLHPLDFS